MTQIPEPFVIANGQTADGDQLEADLAVIRSICNGQLELGVNVQAGSTGANLSGNASTGGASGLASRADHQHKVQGLERLASDPTTGNSVGREYFDTTNLRTRLCVALGSPDSWVTTGNLTAADLPTHSSRHATGGADPLPANSVAQSMFAARTIYQGVPAADVPLGSGAWVDIVTGLAVTVTGTQVAWLVVNVAAVNLNGTNSPNVGVRVIDGGSNVLFQTGLRQFSASAANNDQAPINAVYPVVLSSSPTLKMQADASLAGVTVRKSQTRDSSTFAATSLSVVVG